MVSLGPLRPEDYANILIPTTPEGSHNGRDVSRPYSGSGHGAPCPYISIQRAAGKRRPRWARRYSRVSAAITLSLSK